MLIGVRVRGVPPGATFNQGSLQGTFGGYDVWGFTLEQLSGLTLTVPDGPVGLALTVTAFSRETSNLSTAESSVPLAIQVTNVSPTATFNAPASGNEGSPITLSLTDPADPSTVDAAAGFTYAFDFGDGYGVFGAGNSAMDTPADNGTRLVKGKIRDKDGFETEYTATVVVTNVVLTKLILLPMPSRASFTWRSTGKVSSATCTPLCTESQWTRKPGNCPFGMLSM